MIDLKLIQELASNLRRRPTICSEFNGQKYSFGHWGHVDSGWPVACFQGWFVRIVVYNIECFGRQIRTPSFHKQELGTTAEHMTQGSKGIHRLPNPSHHVFYSKKSHRREWHKANSLCEWSHIPTGNSEVEVQTPPRWSGQEKLCSRYEDKTEVDQLLEPKTEPSQGTRSARASQPLHPQCLAPNPPLNAREVGGGCRRQQITTNLISMDRKKPGSLVSENKFSSILKFQIEITWLSDNQNLCRQDTDRHLGGVTWGILNASIPETTFH